MTRALLALCALASIYVGASAATLVQQAAGLSQLSVEAR